jgi:tRNA G10  N-methylase Trm11
MTDSIQLMRSDMQQLPFPDHSIDTICADLPFGQLVGDHVTNRELYPRTLQEVARIATSNARFVLLTHEIRLMTQLLQQSDLWINKEQYPINLNGLHPRIYVLERKV